jgi:hypothetical protein
MATGKTWCADQLAHKRHYIKVSLAAKLKAIAYEMYGIQGKDGNDRLVLQGLGTDLRKYDKDVWIKYLLNYIRLKTETLPKPYQKFVIDDVRYLNEANILRNNGFVIIRVVTPPDLLSGRLSRLYPNRPAEAVLHASETEQEGIVPNYTFNNDEQLSNFALNELMDQIINEK